jgi:hypothetical protein
MKEETSEDSRVPVIKNQPPRPGKQNCRHFKVNNPGHPSFKRRGNLYIYKPDNYDGFRY